MALDAARRESSVPPTPESAVIHKPVMCQHELYERWVEDHRFARAQCLRCPQSWVEIDISMEPAVGAGVVAEGLPQPLRRFNLEGDELGLTRE